MFFVAEIIVPLWLRTRTRELLKSNNRPNEVAENLWVRAGSQKKRPSRSLFLLKVAEPGLEPRQTEPESAVLPLHNSAICMRS